MCLDDSTGAPSRRIHKDLLNIITIYYPFIELFKSKKALDSMALHLSL